MASSYFGLYRPPRFSLLVLLVIANGLFAFHVIFAWTLIAFFVAEPIAWATWTPLGINSRPGLFEYPFVLLWSMPALGVGAAWVARTLGNRERAKEFALLPILVLGLIFGWYYLGPMDWH